VGESINRIVKALCACIWVELLKFHRSKIGWMTLAVFFLFSMFAVTVGDFEYIPIFLGDLCENQPGS
jgi:hypothetical protein